MSVSDADVGDADMGVADIDVRLSDGDAVVHGGGDADVDVVVVVADVDLEIMIVPVCVLHGGGAAVDPVGVPALELGNEGEIV